MTDGTKKCGPCNLCCKVMDIPDLAKPAGVLCQHVRTGEGCGIYGSRPSPCRVFVCQWLLNPDLPHKYRPDQTKVILTVDGDPQRQRLVANCDPANPLAWKREPIYGLLKRRAELKWSAGATVVAKAGTRLWLITPGEDIDLGDVHPKADFTIQQTEAGGKVTVTVLPPPDAEQVA